MTDAFIPIPISDETPSRTENTVKAATAIECFTPGTLIATLQGPKPTEALRRGDMLLTRDNGFQPLVWKGARRERFSATQSRPVLIEKDALGPGQPARATVVSPTHKVLRSAHALPSAQAEPEVLVEARALVGTLPGVRFADVNKADYVHLLLDRHEVILGNGAWMESFRLSRPAAAILRAARCAPVLSAFPNLKDSASAALQTPARCILPGILGFDAPQVG